MKPTLFPRHAWRPAQIAAAAALACTMLAPAMGADSKAAGYYEDALTRYEKRDMPGAIIQLKNALQIDKSMLPVQVLLGKALLANGEAAAAEVAFAEALRLGVNRAEIIVPLARAYVAQGKQKALKEQAQFQTSGLPPNVQVEILLLRASAAADLGDVRDALRTIDEARALDARSADVWLAEVPIRIRSRQFREASEAVTRAIALAPDSAEAQYQRGSVLHVQGDVKGALAAYDQAVKLDARHVEARVTRAGLYVDLRRYDDAARDLDELARLSLRDPRGAYLRALLAERDNKPQAVTSALKEVTELLDRAPPEFMQYRPQMLMLNGLAHFGLNEREKAKPYLESFQRLQNGTPVSKLLAQIYLQESNVDRAVEVLESYLKAQPADGQALVLLASANMAQGRNAKAASLMQEALRSKDAPEFRTVLGLSFLGGGQMSQAVTELETAFKQDPGQTRAGTALAAMYLRGGQNVKAAQVARQLVQRQPGNAALQDLLGMALAESGDLAGGRAAFEQAVKLDPALLAPKLHLARMDISARKLDAATTRLDALMATNDKDVDVLMEMSVLAGQKGQGDEVKRWLEKANDNAGPRDVRPGLALIDLNLRRGQAIPALDIAKRVLAKAPDDVVALVAYARTQLATGDRIGARTSLTNATRVADFNAPQQVEIAGLQMAAGGVDGAAYSLEKALSTRPDFLPALAMMTSVELSQRDWAKAEKRARQISEQFPKRAVGYSLLGDVASAKGQGAAAVEFYRKAHQTEPSTETLLRVFRASWSQDGGKSSTNLAEQWLKTHPGDRATRTALADGYARAGKWAAAKGAYEDLLKTDPSSGAVLNNLANVLSLMKDPGAVAMAEKAVEKAPADANAIDTLGWLLYQAGNAEQLPRALQLLRDARLRDPANPVIRYHLATVLAKSGRKSEARSELDVALKAGKSFEYAADVEKLLVTLQ